MASAREARIGSVKSDKKLWTAAVAAVALWGVLFGMLVYPQWTARDTQLAAAQDKLESLQKLITAADGTESRPKAEAEVNKERAVLSDALAELKHIEMGDLGKFKLSAAGSGDPAAYFAQMRRTVSESAGQGKSPVRLGDKVRDNLDFGELAQRDPPALNLVRLFVVTKFLEAAKDAGVQEIVSIEYPAPTPLVRPEGLEIERLIQLPLVVKVRADERSFAQLLYELQPSPTDARLQNTAASRYFCVRGVQSTIKDPRSTVLDGVVSVGALFPESQMKEQKVEVKEDRGPTLLRPPPLQPY
jgi:hypothetical protein